MFAAAADDDDEAIEVLAAFGAKRFLLLLLPLLVLEVWFCCWAAFNFELAPFTPEVESMATCLADLAPDDNDDEAEGFLVISLLLGLFVFEADFRLLRCAEGNVVVVVVVEETGSCVAVCCA